MPRYIVNEQVFLRPAREIDGEQEPDVIIEITEERAGPLLAKGIISSPIISDPPKKIEPPAISDALSSPEPRTIKTPAKKSGGQKRN